MIDPNSPQYLAQKKFLQDQSELFKKNSDERKTINIVTIGCSSTNLDDKDRRIPSSHKIMDQVLNYAKSYTNEIEVLSRTHILEDLNFNHCEGNYSTQ